MTLQTDAVQQSCRAVAREIRDYCRNLNLSFIVHHTGEKVDALTLAGQELLTHPAGETILRLLKSAPKDENSSFLGLAAWQESFFMGLASRDNVLALTTLNMEEFDSLRSIRSQAWHMAWHSIFLYSRRDNPRYETQFSEGIVFPDLKGSALASANLRADVFSAVMCTLNGDKDAIRRLAHSRSMDALIRHAGHKPEDYPFAIALEATQFAYSEMMRQPPSKKKQITAALDLADNVGKTYDDLALKQWIYFCKPAQDMAWRGDNKEFILGAAISTSQDTYIRATGFLISEITKIKPTPAIAIQEKFSPFAEDRYNQKLHETMIERAFEKAVNAGLLENNGSAFSYAANEQNIKLTDGHTLGWCAAALQAAGRAFDDALMNGSKNALQDARREFEGVKHKTTWATLKELGEIIIKQYRQGHHVTLSEIIEFCEQKTGLADVSGSINVTMKDPAYIQKLNIANDLAPVVPNMGPKAAPKVAPTVAPATPAVAAAPPLGPGMRRPVVTAQPAPSLDLSSDGMGPPVRQSGFIPPKLPPEFMAEEKQDK